MIIRWPFITRRTLQEAVADKDARIAELKADLSKTQDELRQLTNQFTWRATGIALYPDLLPEAYRPKTGPAPTEPEASPLERDIPSGLDKLRKQTGTTNIRANLKAWEQSRQTLYDMDGVSSALTSDKPLSEEHKLRIVRAATQESEAFAAITKGIEGH
jgi:hypothetical protein